MPGASERCGGVPRWERTEAGRADSCIDVPASDALGPVCGGGEGRELVFCIGLLGTGHLCSQQVIGRIENIHNKHKIRADLKYH